MNPGLVVHIAAGTVGIMAGAAALSVAKGERFHRAFGTAFLAAMAITTMTGIALALFIPKRGVVVGGIFTLYFIATAWMIVRRKPGTIGALEYAAFLLALGCAAIDLLFGLEARANPAGRLDGYAPGFFYGFGAFAFFAAILDLNMIRRHGLTGAARIARHLWRMCFALLIGSATFFLGQRKIMPAAIAGSPLPFLPELLVLGVMIFWLIRVRMAKRPRRGTASP